MVEVRMRLLVLVWAILAIGSVAQIPTTAPPPQSVNVVLSGTEGRVVVPPASLSALMDTEPQINAPDGAPRDGKVTLWVKISKSGAVTDASARQGDDALRQAAVDGAVAGLRYRPLLVNGQPEDFQSIVVISFNQGIGSVDKPVASGSEGTGVSGSSAPSRPVKVPAAVMAGLLVHKGAPVYPPIAIAAHVSGAVIMLAMISKTGDVESVQVVSGPPMLVVAAKEAVQKWKYRPYQVSGEPTEVQTTISVNFDRAPDLFPGIP